VGLGLGREGGVRHSRRANGGGGGGEGTVLRGSAGG